MYGLNPLTAYTPYGNFLFFGGTDAVVVAIPEGAQDAVVVFRLRFRRLPEGTDAQHHKYTINAIPIVSVTYVRISDDVENIDRNQDVFILFHTLVLVSFPV